MKEDYEIHPLTSTQSEFAARHHDLVFRYLRTRHLPEEEFYSEVILGYLAAVQRYDELPQLHNGDFSLLAFTLMDSAASAYLEDRNRLWTKEISLQEPSLREMSLAA